MKLRFSLFASLLSALAITAMGQTPPSPGVHPPSLTEEDPAVVRLLGETITERQILDAIDELARRQQLSPEDARRKESILFRPALERMIGIVLLKNAAREEKITADVKKVDEAIQGIATRFPSAEAFRAALATDGVTEADLRGRIEESLVIQQVLEKALRGIPSPTDEQVRKFYDENPQFFQEETQVRAAHILLKADRDATPERRAELRARLEEIRARIESGAIEFEAAAATYSDDKSNAESGGDLGFFPRGRMVAPFEEAAFEATAGTVTHVVETQFGYHLIKVIEHRPAGKAPIESASENIRSFLARQSQQEAAGRYVASLREKADVVTVMTEEEWTKRHPARP